jgi:hypothetical protein
MGGIRREGSGEIADSLHSALALEALIGRPFPQHTRKSVDAAFHVSKDFVVRESNHPDSGCAQQPVTTLVAFGVVCRTIDLDGDTLLCAIEVDNEPPDHMLAAKSKPSEPTTTQLHPHQAFCIDSLGAELASAALHPFV